MRGYLFVLIMLAQFTGGSVTAQERHFPLNVLDEDSQVAEHYAAWYSKHLTAMNEPSLSSTKIRAETYRVLWLRTFDAPMAFRLIVAPDGTAALITKKMGGRGGYEPGKLILDKQIKLSNQETRVLIEGLERANFWRLASADPNDAGYDGSQWVVEGVKGGTYHVVSRWIGNGITDWALPIMKQSGEDLQPIY